MSFHLISIDQLMQLDIPTLTYALSLFQKELDGTIAYMNQSLEARTDQKLLDDLQSLLTLRKTFTLRLEELKQEEAINEVASQLGIAQDQAVAFTQSVGTAANELAAVA